MFRADVWGGRAGQLFEEMSALSFPRIADLAIIPPGDREKIVYLMDGLIRDAKARQVYRPDGPQDDDAGK